MSRLKLLLALVVFLTLLNVKIQVEGTEGPGGNSPNSPREPGYGLESVVRGAVEDQSWMYAGSRGEVRDILGRYYRGLLLEDLVSRAWDFIDQPTDLYTTARLKDMRVVHDDGDRVVVEALIGIEEVDSGHNETGKGLFVLSRAGGCPRVDYTAFKWNIKP